MSECPLYQVKSLWKSYSNGTRKVEVLRGIDLTVYQGESIAITGPSGVGKSTLMHILGLLDRPVSGNVLLDGVDVLQLGDSERARVRNRRVGFVFQFFQLLPEFSALENVIMPGLICGQREKDLIPKATAILEEVGLAERTTHRPGELSGGEQQRVAVARALIMNPDVLLADEPTGNLDPETGQEIEVLLRNLNELRKTTLIVVTHKESLAKTMTRRVGLVGGKIEELQ
jgi:lipoprotein-releasing system ATP-binding protein